MKKLIIAVAAILIITSCEKEKLGNSQGDNMIVVQGYLYAGQTVDSIRLSQTVLLNSVDTLFQGITNASVSIGCNGTIYPLTATPNMPGYYHSDPALVISAGNNYNLSITYNNTDITSQTNVPTNPTALQISDTVITIDTTLTSFRGLSDTSTFVVSWSNPEKDYYFVILTFKDSTLKPITYVFTNPRTGETSIDTVRGNFTRRFRSSPIQSSSYSITASSMSSYGNYEFKLYKVTKDYANLYLSRNQSTINLNEPFTNINNGLGIFTAFSVADSFTFRVVKKIQ